MKNKLIPIAVDNFKEIIKLGIVFNKKRVEFKI